MAFGDNKSLRIRYMWLAPCAAAAVAMLAAGFLVPMFFGSNDDPYVIQILSGGGGVAAEPLPMVPFVSYGLCWVFSSLYLAVPAVPWWIVFHLASIFAALSLVGHALLVAGAERARDLRPALMWVLLCLVDFCASAYFVGRLQFTNTSALLIAAAIVGACCRPAGGGSSLKAATILSSVMGTVGFALRAQSGYLGFFFWGLTVAALMVRGSGRLRGRLMGARHALLPFLCAGAAALMLMTVNAAAYSSPGLTAKNAFGSAMSGYTDYPHPSFDEAPARYEEVGWDEELSELAGQWFMMDERVSTEALAALNEQNTAPIDNLLSDPVDTVMARLHDVAKPVPMTYFALLLGTAVVALALSPSRGERAVICLTCAAVIVLLGYLLLRGRLLERAAYAVTIPATAALLTVVLRNVMVPRQEGRSTVAPAVACVLGLALLAPLGYRAEIIARMAYALGAAFCIAVAAWAMLARREFASVGRARLVAAVLAAALVLAPGVVTVKKLGVGSWEARRQEELLANTQAFFDYVRERSDTLYVYAGCPITMQYVWQGDWPVNQTGWGGWRWPYEWFDEAMRAAGFDGRPTSEDFLDGDALFVSGSESTCDLLLRYMRSTHGDDVQMIQVDEIAGSMRVYQFLRGED